MIRTGPLKIAICSWAAGIGGGAARMETYYCRYYDRSKLVPTLISLVKRDTEQASYDPEIPFIQIDLENRFVDLVKILKEGEFDIVQFQGSFNPLVCEAAKAANIPLLIEVLHNIEDGGLFENIDLTICVSKAVEGVQKTAKNFCTITNGISLSDFTFKTDKVPQEKITLLQVGRRSKATVNLDMIAAQLNLPNVEYWICGGEQFGTSTEKVKFLGVVSDIEKLYKEADYLIQLSDNEPFGLVALEAMASGTPVILTNSGGFKEIVTNHEDGYLLNIPIDENEILKLTNILQQRNNVKYEILRLNARKKVVEKFDILGVIKNYENVILECFDKKNFVTTNNSCGTIPPNAIVGEALLEFNDGNANRVAEKMKQLSLSTTLVNEIYCLKISHDLAIYLKLNPNPIYPKGLFSYLFACGDCIESCLEFCSTEPDELFKRGCLDKYFNMLIKEVEKYFPVLLVFLEHCFTLGLKNEVKIFIERTLAGVENRKEFYLEVKKLETSFYRNV